MAAQSDTAAQCREVARLVRQLTESGRDSPDPSQLQQLKQLCRRGDAVIDAMYERALKQLRRQHAQVRLSALQLLDQLFRRSHRLRTRLVSDLPTVLDLCFETGGTLPPPRAVAKQLTATAAAALTHWTEKYGSAYKKLSVGYRYLHQVRPGDMPPTAEERQEAAAEEERRQEELRRLRQVKLEQVEREVSERRAEILDTVTQAESCLQLLVPDVEMWDAGDDGRGAIGGTVKSEEESLKSLDMRSSNNADGKCDSKTDDASSVTSGSSLLHSEHPTKSADSEAAKSPAEPSDSEETDDEAEYDEYDPDYAETGLLRSHGLTSARQTVQVTVSARPRPLAVTEDNRCVVEALQELAEQVRRHQLPDVQRWLQLTTAAGGDEGALASLRTVRAALTSVLRRYSLLQLSPTTAVAADSSDDDSDLEEVPELTATRTVAAASGSASAKGRSFDQAIDTDRADRKSGGSLIDRSWVAPDPSLKSQDTAGSNPSGVEDQRKMHQSSIAANSAQYAQSPSVTLPVHTISSTETSHQGAADVPAKPEAEGSLTGEPAASAGEGSDSGTERSAAESRKQRLLRVAPVLDYSADLVTWERQLGSQMAPPAPQMEVARVWRGSSEADLPASSAPDTVRVAEFTGRFEPVQHRCGARLPSGRLCPRADRLRCPLHGPIIPRDSRGEPLDPAERSREKEARARGPDWQDPKLLAEILAKTGQDLRVSRGRRRDSGPGLVPIHAATSRQRLSNKLFCGRTVRRLAAALNQLDARRHGDKFADQFNYHFNR